MEAERAAEQFKRVSNSCNGRAWSLTAIQTHLVARTNIDNLLKTIYRLEVETSRLEHETYRLNYVRAEIELIVHRYYMTDLR